MDRAKFEAIREQFRTEAKERMDSSAIYELRKKYLDRKGGLVDGREGKGSGAAAQV